MRSKKIKMKTKDPRFIPTHTGVLTMSKEYKQMLIDSEDKDYIKLAKMGGVRIAFQMPSLYIKFPGVPPTVNICDPFEGTISKAVFKKIEAVKEGE